MVMSILHWKLLSNIIATRYCLAEIISTENGNMYDWPRTPAGGTATLTCPFNASELVLRNCSDEGFWQSYSEDGCNTVKDALDELNSSFANVRLLYIIGEGRYRELGEGGEAIVISTCGVFRLYPFPNLITPILLWIHNEDAWSGFWSTEAYLLKMLNTTIIVKQYIVLISMAWLCKGGTAPTSGCLGGGGGECPGSPPPPPPPPHVHSLSYNI